MGNLTEREELWNAMRMVLMDTEPMKAWAEAVMQFCREEMPAEIRGTTAEFAAAARMCDEFDQIWPHRLPCSGELVEAHHAGRLQEKIAELNAEFAASL